MKYLKMLGLAAIAAAALMAFVGASTASATELTCKNATSGVLEMCAAPTHIHAVNESTVTLHPPIGDIECSSSTVTGSASTGSASTTVTGAISALSFSNCNTTVDVISAGSLEIHTTSASADGSGTLTSIGAEVTIELGGFHCIAKTGSGTDIGKLTGSKSLSNGTATFDISASIPVEGGFFCGSTAEWTGSYKVTTPDYLDVD